MARSVIGMYIVGFFFVFVSFFTGVAGCWKRSKGNILATGLLQMLAGEYTATTTYIRRTRECYNLTVKYAQKAN